MPNYQDMLHITSFLIQVKTQLLESVVERLASVGGIEVAMDSPEGKIIAVLEAHSHKAIAETMDEIRSIFGVLNVVMVYHHQEEASALEQTIDIGSLAQA